MFDDLEDLLDDVPQPKKQTITSSGGKAPSVSSSHAAAKKPSPFSAEEEFDWDKPQAAQRQPPKKAETFGKADVLAGGSAADWGNADWDDEPLAKASKPAKQTAKGDMNDDIFGGGNEWGASKSNNYSAFGVLGKSRSGMFGNKRNSTGGEDPGADLLDNILDDMEEKKGIETSKKSGAASVGSQSASHSQQPQ